MRGKNLKILGLVSSDGGVYQCLATNPAGSIQAAAILQVKSKGINTISTQKIYNELIFSSKSILIQVFIVMSVSLNVTVRNDSHWVPSLKWQSFPPILVFLY